MTPRRPSSAQNDTGPQRLPFATAEALLWGPEMKKQHHWLLQQMRGLTTHHEAYDARIQATEAIAEAAEAAIARIRHMEQQIITMEAVDKENTLENWAMAEINQLKTFRDDNKTVRQKQIELDKEVKILADDVVKVKRVPDELVKLIKCVDFLGSRQKEDDDRIKRLEKELEGVKNGQHKPIPLQPMVQPFPQRQSSYHRTMTPPRRVPVPGADDNSETEDEDSWISPKMNAQRDCGRVQVAASPGTENALDALLGPSSTQLPSIRSARQRLFKRPSIHDSKLPRLLEEIQRQGEDIQPRPAIRTAPTAPATLLVNVSSTSKQKQPINNAVIQRKSRSHARSPERVREQPPLLRKEMKVSEQPTQIVTRRPANPRKRIIDTGPSSTITQDTSKRSTQLVAMSPRKKPRVTALARPNKEVYNASSQADITNSSQQKQLIVVLKTQDAQEKKSDLDDMQHSAAGSGKTSPRKAPVKPRSCIACSQRQMACDKAQPACGPCVKRLQGHACVYQPSHEALTRSVKPTITSPRKVAQDSELAGPSGLNKGASIAQCVPGKSLSLRKRQVQSNAIAGSSGTNRRSRAARKGSVSSIRPASPEEPSASLRPREAKTRATAAISTNSTRRARRAIPDTRDLDFDTFLKMKKENPKF